MNQSPQSKLLVTSLFIAMMVIGFLLLRVAKTQNNTTGTPLGTSTSTVDGKQIIEILAKGGYSPALINANANIDTILRVKTLSTFDCSSALTIPKLGIRKNLPPTATTDIPLGSQAAGATITGTCSMGMYSFKLNFK